MSNDVLAAIMKKAPGELAVITYERPLKMRAGQAPVSKRTSTVVRIGLKYNDLPQVKADRASGKLPKEPQMQKGVVWLTDSLANKAYMRQAAKADTPSMYLRCFKLQDGETDIKTTVQYFRAGEEVQPFEIEHLALKNQVGGSTSNPSPIFDLKIENIIKFA